MGDTIGFAPALDGQTITLASTLPDVADQAGLTIDGSEIGTNITVSGNDQHQVFYVADGAKLTLTRLTVANGHNAGPAAAYTTRGDLKGINSTIAENRATSWRRHTKRHWHG